MFMCRQRPWSFRVVHSTVSHDVQDSFFGRDELEWLSETAGNDLILEALLIKVVEEDAVLE